MTSAPKVTDRRTSPNHSARAKASRVEMIVVHWTGGAFEGTMDWIGRSHDPKTGEPIYASYHAVIGANGEVAYPVPWTRASYSVGKSKPDDPRFTWTTGGNSASDNIALAGCPPKPPTAAQRALLIDALAWRMRARGWGAADVWRIRPHSGVAWARGRKSDPDGSGWLPLEPIRQEVAKRLAA